MSATTVMAVAIVGGIIGRWAHNKPVVSGAAGVVKVIFAVVLIAALDSGSTQDVARGFAWLFLAGVLLSNSSPLTGIAKTVNPASPKKTPPKKGKK